MLKFNCHVSDFSNKSISSSALVKCLVFLSAQKQLPLLKFVTVTENCTFRFCFPSHKTVYQVVKNERPFGRELAICCKKNFYVDKSTCKTSTTKSVSKSK